VAEPTTRLPTIIRPNGKVYRPRKIRAIYCENDYGQRDSVIVLGTHDELLAMPIASGEARYRMGSTNFLFDAIGETGWWREAIERGERVVRYDDVHGAAGVRFDVEER
jgi:hypothetical protein